MHEHKGLLSLLKDSTVHRMDSSGGHFGFVVEASSAVSSPLQRCECCLCDHLTLISVCERGMQALLMQAKSDKEAAEWVKNDQRRMSMSCKANTNN